MLAKSIPARAFEVKTGEALAQALHKCPQLCKRNRQLSRPRGAGKAKGQASGCPQVQGQAGIGTGKIMMKRGEQANERNL